MIKIPSAHQDPSSRRLEVVVVVSQLEVSSTLAAYPNWRQIVVEETRAKPKE